MKHSLDREEVGAVCMLDLEIDVGRKKKKWTGKKPSVCCYVIQITKVKVVDWIILNCQVASL